MDLVRNSFPADPAVGPALARLLMEQVAAGERGETLRIARAGRAIAFGRRDRVSPGYREAVEAGENLGYPGIERLSGGRAAVYEEGTIVIGRTVPSRSPASGTEGRFEAMAESVGHALGALGIETGIGEVPGEYCPGRFSLNAGGSVKLVGIGQRMVSGAAHVGVVIPVSATGAMREAIAAVYRALGLDWDPDSAGSIEDYVPGATPEQVESALIASFSRSSDLRERELDEDTLTRAAADASRFRSRPPADGQGPRPGR